MVDSAGNRYGPYDVEVAGSQSESLTEDAWFDLFGQLSGVKSGGALTFSGLTATLAAIDARVKGSYLIRTSSWSVTSDATVTSSPRRDLLVARRQRTSGTTPGKTFLVLLKGTPAATPADPPYDAVNDEPLWSWQVPGSGGAVVTNVRDRRRFLDGWNGTDKSTQAMISLQASQALGTAGTLYQLQTSDWDSTVDHGAGQLTLVGGAIRCERAGRVRVDAFAVSDASDAGWSWLAVGLPFEGGNHLGGLDDRRPRATGFPGSGLLRQAVTAGPIVVEPGDLISYSLAQQNTASAAITYQCYLAVTYV